jgi:MoxR-like ATPase
MPYHPDLPSLDPRQLVRSFGPDVAAAQAALARLLAGVGHRAPAPALRTLTESLRSGKPFLAEGAAGCGKTALALALAEACNCPLFKLACRPGVTPGDLLLEWNAPAQRTHLERGGDADEIWTRDFLTLGVVAQTFAAMQRVASPILLLDEVDKLEPRFGDALLEALSEWRITVPRLRPNSEIAIPDGERPPLVILTSNNLYGGLSEPLRKRSLYLFFPEPSPTERLAILAARCPQAPDELLAQAAAVFAVINEDAFIDEPPELRNHIAFLTALLEKDIAEILPDHLVCHVMYLAANASDQRTLTDESHRILRHANARRAAFRSAVAAARTLIAETPRPDPEELSDLFDRFPADPVHFRRAAETARRRSPAQTGALDQAIARAFEELAAQSPDPDEPLPFERLTSDGDAELFVN